MKQCELGWLFPPLPLPSTDTPFNLNFPKLHVAFRFGAEQSDKLRACDDLRHAETNLACVVETPINPVSRDHLVAASNLVSKKDQNWAMFKADHEAAYKRLPVAPEHAKLSVIALRSPPGKRWYGFITRTLVFGAIAAVLLFNVFSRLLRGLFTQLFGISLLCFFDDFGALVPLCISEEALQTFALFFAKL